MDMIQLRYFLRVAETLNYSRAAESLYISRQSLRQTLGNLEKELGQSLFINDHNHLSLTEYGEYLVLNAQGLVADFERMEADVTRFFRQSVTLHVAFSVSLFPSLLPNIDPILQEFMAGHPNISLNIDRSTADQVVDGAENQELDCGIVLQMPCSRPRCSSLVLRSSDVGIGSGPESPLYGKTELTPEELSAVPLVGMGSLEKIARPLWEDCRRKGIILDYQVVPNYIDAIHQIKNSHAASFNTYLKNPNRLPTPDPGAPKARLSGYTWELVALCPKARPNYHAARLLATFLREKYRSL